MSSVIDLGHALIVALAISGGGQHSTTPSLIDPPALIAAARVHAGAPTNRERWLDSVHRAGREAGLATEAGRIFLTRSGRAYAPILEERAAILSLANDPAVAAAVTYHTARADAAALQTAFGAPAHFTGLAVAQRVGLEPALRLLSLATAMPDARVTDRLPEIASAHPDLASSGGRPTTAKEAVAMIVAGTLPGSVHRNRLNGADGKPPAIAGWLTRVSPAPRARP